MTATPKSVADVHDMLLDRIVRGAIPVGARLPSCRDLARDLGSNPSTVDRAIQRLGAQGLVRTVPRKGTFVVGAGLATSTSREVMATQLYDVLGRAWSAGMSLTEIRGMVDDAIGRLDRRPRVAFVECNREDLERMGALVSMTSGIEVELVLLDEIRGRMLDQEYDVVAAPLFHLTDLVPLVRDVNTVVEINFVASPALLRRLATLDPRRRVVVVAATPRGAERMGALVRQYFSGPFATVVLGRDDPSPLRGAATVIRNNAASIPDAEAWGIGEVIAVEWELPPGFAATFRSRVERALALARREPGDCLTQEIQES